MKYFGIKAGEAFLCIDITSTFDNLFFILGKRRQSGFIKSLCFTSPVNLFFHYIWVISIYKYWVSEPAQVELKSPFSGVPVGGIKGILWKTHITVHCNADLTLQDKMSVSYFIRQTGNSKRKTNILYNL